MSRKEVLNAINTSKALYIHAKLHEIDIQITIDTGANIICITHTLIPHKNKITKETMKITGPSNEPLKLTGSTQINISILNTNFEIKVFIITNLSRRGSRIIIRGGAFYVVDII